MLKVSGDGRKAALDLRLVGLPPDPDGGKLAAAAERIARIHHDTRDRAYLGNDQARSPHRGALQLVFCDLGTPHNDGRWTAYDQLRAELVARGVPAESIRFMHEARNDPEKARLFAAARAGAVSVLIGSTEKMGVGTNVQARAVALHHLDCPWRPADLEQRDGRILRQGNQNPEVRIMRYVTEGSFDVFSWQTVERKATFIAQIMRGDVTERTVDDVGDQALSYSEVKALATGNPLIMERAGVESELTRLERLQATYRNEQGSLARRVRSSEQLADEQDQIAGAFTAAAANAVDTTGDRFTMTVEGRDYPKRAEAGTALQAASLHAADRLRIGDHQVVTVGRLAGFDVIAGISREAGETSYRFGLAGVPRGADTVTRGQLRNANPLGLISRLENLAGDLPARAATASARAAEARQEAQRAAARVGQPFEHGGRIASLRERLTAIDAQLAPQPAAEDGGAGPEAPEPVPVPARGPSPARTVPPRAHQHDPAHRRRPNVDPGRPGHGR